MQIYNFLSKQNDDDDKDNDGDDDDADDWLLICVATMCCDRRTRFKQGWRSLSRFVKVANEHITDSRGMVGALCHNKLVISETCCKKSAGYFWQLVVVVARLHCLSGIECQTVGPQKWRHEYQRCCNRHAKSQLITTCWDRSSDVTCCTCSCKRARLFLWHKAFSSEVCDYLMYLHGSVMQF